MQTHSCFIPLHYLRCLVGTSHWHPRNSTGFSFRSYWQVPYWVSLFPQKQRLLVSFFCHLGVVLCTQSCFAMPLISPVMFLWHITAWLLTFHYKSVFLEADKKYFVCYDYRNGRPVHSWTGHLSHGCNCGRLASKAEGSSFQLDVPEYHYKLL